MCPLTPSTTRMSWRYGSPAAPPPLPAVRLARAAAPHRGAVDHARLAAPRLEGGDQHERVVEGLAGRAGPVACRGDRAVPAAPPVEQAAEAAAAVDPRHAAPVDRSFARHEGDRMAVPNQGVVTYRRVYGHR